MRNTLLDLPVYWQREIKSMRAENAKYRRARNESRAEAGGLRYTVATMRERIELLTAELDEVKAAQSK